MMRRCFYHTDLIQNAVFHNFSGQIAFIQYSDHRSTRGPLAKPFKKFPKSPMRPPGSYFCTSAKYSVNIKRVSLQHNKEFIVFIFLFNGFTTMCNLKKRLIRGEGKRRNEFAEWHVARLAE